MSSKVIIIDGESYNSMDEMPAEIRQKYEQAMRALGDANHNGIPDVFETLNILADKDRDKIPDVLEELVAGQATVNTMKIIVDGKEFDGIDTLPAEARARYEEAMGRLDVNGNGIPDFVESAARSTEETPLRSADVGIQATRREIAPTGRPTLTPDTSNGWGLVLTGLFIFALCVAGTWYLFLR